MRALRAAKKVGAKRVIVGADGSIDIWFEGEPSSAVDQAPSGHPPYSTDMDTVKRNYFAALDDFNARCEADPEWSRALAAYRAEDDAWLALQRQVTSEWRAAKRRGQPWGNNDPQLARQQAVVDKKWEDLCAIELQRVGRRPKQKDFGPETPVIILKHTYHRLHF